MKIFYLLSACLLLGGCPGDGTDPSEVVFELRETELPGVFEVVTTGMDPNAGYGFECDDGQNGSPTILEGLWLAARDRVEIDTKCYLKGTTDTGASRGTSPRTLRKGMLETQAQLLDPTGDSGLDAWERRALGSQLEAPLPDGISHLVHRDERRRLVVRSPRGQAIWARQWSSEGLSHVQVESEGDDPCAGIPRCVERLFGFFENPKAPDLVAIPEPQTALGSHAAEHGDLSATSSQAAFLAWGAGVQPGAQEANMAAVDLAPTLAAALGLGYTLGRDRDGALNWTQFKRVDGVARDDLITAGRAEQVIIITIDGLSVDALATMVEQSEGFKQLRDEGLWLSDGLLTGYPSKAMPGHHTLGSGLWSGHHGIYDDALFDRRENTWLDLVDADGFVGSRARFREHAETLHQALAERPSPAMQDAWSVSAGSASFIGATTNALEGSGPGGEGWMNIGREPGFVNLPQAPDWTSGATYSAWENSIMLAEFTQRIVTGVQVAGERPSYTIANLAIYDQIAHQFGPQSEQAGEALMALDFMLNRLIAALKRRDWQDSVTLIVTAAHGLSESDQEQPRPAWWNQGNPWTDQGMVVRSNHGNLIIEAMAFDKEIKNGFVTFNLRDADSNNGLGGVSLTTYNEAGEELATRLSDDQGVLRLPQPSDRTIWGVLRATGYSELRLSAVELQL